METVNDSIKRGHELVLHASRLAMLARSGFPRSRDLADKLRRIAIKSDDVHNCVIAYAHAQGELTKTEQCGLQILLTHEEFARFESSN